MNDLTQHISKGLMYTSIVMFIISLVSSNQTSYKSTMVGYTTLLCGTLLILIPLWNTVISANSSFNLKTASILFHASYSYTFVILVLGCLISLSLIYKDIIQPGHTAPAYFNYVNLSTLLLLFSIWIMAIRPNLVGQALPDKYSSLLMLANVLNGVCVVILYILLEFYTTDG